MKLFVRLPTSGATPSGRTSNTMDKVMLIGLRRLYSSQFARHAGSWAITALATCALRLLPRKFFLTIINSPQLGHKPVFAAAEAGKVKVVSVFHGSDIRPPYLNGLLTPRLSVDEIHVKTRVLRETAAMVEHFSFRVITWAKIGHFMGLPYLCHELIGFPVEPLDNSFSPRVAEPDDSPLGERTFRIIHAPSSNGKGTERIKAAVETLQMQGVNVSLNVVSGLTSIELFKEIRQHDLVVDQIYADSAPSVLAMECLMLGAPVLMGGWSIAETSADFKAFDELCVFDSEEIELVLSRLITDRETYKVLRQKQHILAQYLAQEWNSEKVADRIVQSLDDSFPVKAWAVPSPPGFSAGGYGPPEEIRSALRRYISKFGTEGLFLEKNPRLQNIVSGWAEQ